MPTSTVTGDLNVTGDLTMGTITLPGGVVADAQIQNGAEIRRAALALDALKSYPINLSDFRVWDAFDTVLPAAAAADDAGLVTGTFGTNPPTIEAGDIGGSSSSRYARTLIRVPAEYADGETLQLQASAGMKTTVSDTTSNIDFEAYKLDEDGSLVGPTDLVATAAQSINSLTFADLIFNLTATSIVAGEILDVRMTFTYNDVGNAGVMIPTLAALKLLADVRG